MNKNIESRFQAADAAVERTIVRSPVGARRTRHRAVRDVL
jgi:hypothetical protein